MELKKIEHDFKQETNKIRFKDYYPTLRLFQIFELILFTYQKGNIYGADYPKEFYEDMDKKEKKKLIKEGRFKDIPKDRKFWCYNAKTYRCNWYDIYRHWKLP